MTDKRDEMIAKWGDSDDHHFRIIDTIGVPHPYCITPKHLEHSHTMYLDVEGAEKESKSMYPNDPRKWAVCDTCKQINKKHGSPILSYKEHRQALLVECDIEVADRDKKVVPELHQFLLKIKERAEKENYEGFAFMKSGGKR